MNRLKLSKAANEAARKIDLVFSREINDPDVVLSMDTCIRIAAIVQIAINRNKKALNKALNRALDGFSVHCKVNEDVEEQYDLTLKAVDQILKSAGIK